MSTYPIDRILPTMSERDRLIYEEMIEGGESDEDMYAALPTPETDKLLAKKEGSL